MSLKDLMTIRKAEDRPTEISKQHAKSLMGIVKYFKAGIPMGTNPCPSEKLTMDYCDELLEDLGNE